MSDAGLPTPFAEQVLDVVAAIPRGRVLTYGDVARLLEQGGPRQVGTVMSRFGGGVPWWRVIRADGRPVASLEADALARLRRERVPLAGGGSRVDLSRARWQPSPADLSELLGGLRP